jgi:hypothetical protein
MVVVPSISDALKCRKFLMKQLDKLRTESSAGVDVSHFEAIESTLEK